ncbi:unnamed protein product [Didymodactylos carnosus]|uniref:Uncharacterized protein n=1 Tax=Didymodactylos carnosus TaxID=1234261 RepID=A0A816CYM8_9BILA|nr:unnamed protein product [Didymodactylos carnosus]CAF1627839.1 unnamed protein product [Didymodactylos carnosus]CAF4110255.1 unnamed protein product [Didymodactylos carnosus]CAF4523746.1 unnamed protein product [Didymodactylos carnosus]
MSEKLLQTSQPVDFSRQPSNVGFDLAYSPCEAGMFNFHKIHQGQKASAFLRDESDAPTLSALSPATGKSSSLFANYATNSKNNNTLNTTDNILKSTGNTIGGSTATTPSLPASASSASFFPLTSAPNKTPTSSLTAKPIHATSSASSLATLTDAFKSAMGRGALSAVLNDQNKQHQRSSSLSKKELNHLFPQSM